MTYMMKKHTTIFQFRPNGIKSLLLMLLLLMLVGVGEAWGKTDYSGTYYIKSASDCKSPSGDYYLCPTEDWAFFHATDNVNSTDNGQPFLTTHIMDSGDEAKYVWVVEKYSIDNQDYYAFKYDIKHEGVSRYLSYNRQLNGAGVDRMRIHLKKTETPGDYELFEITEGDNIVRIMPKLGDEDASNTRKYLVVNGGNTNYFQAYFVNKGGVKEKKDGPSDFTLTTGIIGTYSASNDVNNPFVFEKAKCKTPVIAFDNVTSKVTITSDNDETIYYTTDGSNPDANSNEYGKPFVLNAGAVVKAISKKDGIIDSEIATLTVEKLATPTITFNEETREVTITTAVEGAVIYYTTDDTDPSIDESTAHAASPVVIAPALPSTKIHAQAVKSGSINSDVATKTDIPVKVLTNPTIILAEEELVYDGSAKEPAITVKDGDVVVSNDEYVVTYSNNTNAGTASVTVSDKANGDYEVSGSMFFIITPKSIGDGDKAAEGIDIQIELMGENVEVTSVKDGGTTLVVDEDYTVAIEKQGDDWIIIVSGIGNYEGSARGLFVLAKFYKAAGADKAVAAYRSPKDFSKPSGIDIYIVRKVNPSIGTVIVSSIDYLPKDVPVLLERNDAVTGFLVSEKPAEDPEITAETKNSNLLHESYKGLEVDAAQIYMMYRGEFVLTKAGTFTEGGKFYLYNPNYKIEPDPEPTPEPDEPSSGESRGVLQIIIEEWDDQDETTGIDDLKNEKTEEWKLTGWYSLDGRRLSGKPTKGGIYIHKGQKIYIKR